MSAILKTDLSGLVNSLPHFKQEALLPVFEAVINSIQAIHQAKISNGKIIVRIIRDSQASLMESKSQDPQNYITRFDIEDNGVGFTDVNCESFKTNHSTHKLEFGCKGVGRFVWLKAFENVEIISTFQNENKNISKLILFNLNKGIDIKDISPQKEIKTTVSLKGFKKDYRESPTAYKKGQTIAQRIFEHCLSYYIIESCPSIYVVDGDDKYNLDEFYVPISKNKTIENIKINGIDFKLAHLKLYSSLKDMHNIVLCGNSRAVTTEKISNYIGVNAEFDEDKNKFIYSLYITSRYLDKNIDGIRLQFLFPDHNDLTAEIQKDDYPVTKDHIIEAAVPRAKEFLKEYLKIIDEQKQDLVSNYVSTVNPTLRAIPMYCPEIFNEIQPNTSQEKLDEVLYKHKGKAELEIKKQSDKILRTQVASLNEIKDEVDNLTKRISDFQKDQLASYIIFRKKTIDLLSKKIELNPSGKFYDEKIIHDLLFPQYATTDSIMYKNHNLWLLDERLTCHAYAKSEQIYSSGGQNDSTIRADIAIYSELQEDKTARAVTIIELKKPERPNFDSNPIEQINRYIKQARNKELKMHNGRTLHTDERTCYYGYAICDINEKIRDFAEGGGYRQIPGERGYYNYNPTYNAHIEIVDFDKIVSDANIRHKALFAELGI